MPERPKRSEHVKPIRPKPKLSKASKVSLASIHRARDTSRTVADHLCHLLPTVVAQTANHRVSMDHRSLAWYTHHKATVRCTTNSNTPTRPTASKVKSTSRVSSTIEPLRSGSDGIAEAQQNHY